MISGNTDYAYVTVNTAVECEVGILRINLIVGGVVNKNNKEVFVFYFGELNSES